MEFNLKNAKKLQHQEWLKKVRKTEDKSLIPPEVIPEARWYWMVFNMLASQRQHGANGPQAIPFSELVVLLDRVYLAHVHKTMDQARKESSQPKVQRRGR